MSNTLNGTVATVESISGTLNAASGYDGKSAYEVAVKNGFEGAEAEWLESLKGEKGDKGDRGEQGIGIQGEKGEKGDTGNSGVYVGSGDMPEDCNVQIDPDGNTLTIEMLIKKVIEETSKISSVTLLASDWIGETSPYSQAVTVLGATENSKIDLNPTIEQLNIFHNKDIAFVVENSDGDITVYCIGQKPTSDYTIQATITEVYANG